VNATIFTDPPTEADRAMDRSLFAYMEKNIILESEEEMQKRNIILAEVKQLFLDWVRYVAVEVAHLSEEESLDVGGQLFISGSHKLGVRECGADIDTVCVAPKFCTRDDFFTSLKEKLQLHPHVSIMINIIIYIIMSLIVVCIYTYIIR
jgi:poly(A) polymerase